MQVQLCSSFKADTVRNLQYWSQIVQSILFKGDQYLGKTLAPPESVILFQLFVEKKPHILCKIKEI